MTGVFGTVSAWFTLVLGVVLLVESGVFFVRGRRLDRDKRVSSYRPLPMLLCLGITLICGSVVRLDGLTGAGKLAAFLIGMLSALAAVFFAVRARAAMRRGQ